MGLKDEELAGLSAEERAALEDGEAEELASLKKIAADDDGDLAAGPAGATGTDENGSAPAAETSGVGADDGEGNASGTPDTGGVTGAVSRDEEGGDLFVPVYQAALPDDFKESLDAVKAEREALVQRFKDGELSFDDFRVADRELQDKETDLLGLRTKAEIAAEMAQQSAAQRWNWEVTRFMRDTLKSEGIDYKNNRLLNAAFDTAVKDLAGAPENSDKSGEWFLEEAHKLVKDQLGIGKVTVPKKEEPAGDPVKAAISARKAAVPVVPKTLGHVPAADESDVGQDEFASLEALASTDVMAYERALAKMTPEQERRFLRSAA